VRGPGDDQACFIIALKAPGKDDNLAWFIQAQGLHQKESRRKKMPTIITHPALPLAAAMLGGRKVSGRLLTAGIVGSILPDADVIGFHLGIPYGHVMGHRGFSHSIAFALLIGLIAMLMARWLRSGRIAAFAFVFIATVSHGLLDALTSGGLGIAFWAPFSNERFFFPWRPIMVSPLSLDRFVAGRGLLVLRAELVWVWLPAMVIGTSGLALRKIRWVPANKKNNGNTPDDRTLPPNASRRSSLLFDAILGIWLTLEKILTYGWRNRDH
jgi:inner membrane protein